MEKREKETRSKVSSLGRFPLWIIVIVTDR